MNDETCWFCAQFPAELFSVEFDTYVHESCLRGDATKRDNPESLIMMRELFPEES